MAHLGGMLKRSRIPPEDLNDLASRIASEATSEETPKTTPPQKPEKDPAAVSLGRRGGKKGGPARAKKLSALFTWAPPREYSRSACRRDWSHVAHETAAVLQNSAHQTTEAHGLQSGGQTCTTPLAPINQ